MTFSPVSKTITNISNANPAVVTTSTDHGFLAGSYVTFFIPYNTMQALNYNTYLATPINATTFSIPEVYRDWETDRKSTRLNSSHSAKSRMPSSA